MPPPVGDSLRAFAVGRQAAVDVAAATLIWQDFVEDYSHKPNLTKDSPEFKINSRMGQRKNYSKTRFDEVNVKIRLDSTEAGWYLVSAAGPPTDSGTAPVVHTFLFGQSQQTPVTATNSMLLTVAWYDGQTNLWWQMINCKANKWDLAIDAVGNITVDVILRGVKATPMTTVPTIAYTPPADNTPFQPWQCVISKGGTAACIVSFKFSVTNNFDPFYCTPTTPPTSTTEAGLYPSRFTDGMVKATWEVIYEYIADAGSSFYDYRHDINEAWIVDCTDPATGIVPEFKLELPALGATEGTIERNKPNVLQSVKGVVLWDSSISSIARATLKNAQTAYTAS